MLSTPVPLSPGSSPVGWQTFKALRTACNFIDAVIGLVRDQLRMFRLDAKCPSGTSSSAPSAPGLSPDPPSPLVLPLQFPEDMPEECPFPVEWHEVINVVLATDGVDPEPLKDAIAKFDAARVINLSDIAARLPGEDPVNIAVDELRGGKGEMPTEMPADLVAGLLRSKFQRDESIEWKFEMVRRQEAITKTEQKVETVKEALAAAEAGVKEAQAKLNPLLAQQEKRGISKILTLKITEAEKGLAAAQAEMEAKQGSLSRAGALRQHCCKCPLSSFIAQCPQGSPAFRCCPAPFSIPALAVRPDKCRH